MRFSSRYVLTIIFSLCMCVALYGVLIGRISVALLRRIATHPVTKSNVQELRQSATEDVQLKRYGDALNVNENAEIRYAPAQKGDIFPKMDLFLSDGSSGVVITASEFNKDKGLKTGNRLIDDYGQNDLRITGEMGRGVTFVGHEEELVKSYLETFRVNVLASDLIPLHRIVPDSRPPGCQALKYPHNLPTASVVIPFHNEWPSIILRTVYSIINRTPRHLLRDIVLVDDASDMPELSGPLDTYVEKMFPKDLVKLIRVKKRVGLTKARLIGWQHTTGQVLVIFDSHMEVNTFWIEPLLYEIKKNRKTVAMGTLDYIDAINFKYKFNFNYQTRYGFDWRLTFFETFFRRDKTWQLTEDQPKEGVITVGTGFAVDSDYFKEIGAYDDGMETWGGENIELGWRVWMCGGRMIHLPCSHIGHIARSQPYSFPKGRRETEVYNYKRAVEVWMEPVHKNIVYDHFPEMKTMDAGDLSKRLELKSKLQCKNFTWYIQNIWPELTVFPENAIAWGAVSNKDGTICLDNHDYLFQAEDVLEAKPCTYQLASQGFSLTKSRQFRTSLQCVVVKGSENNFRVALEDCFLSLQTEWMLHRASGQLQQLGSKHCLALDETNSPVMRPCDVGSIGQVWRFQHYTE